MYFCLYLLLFHSICFHAVSSNLLETIYLYTICLMVRSMYHIQNAFWQDIYETFTMPLFHRCWSQFPQLNPSRQDKQIFLLSYLFPNSVYNAAQTCWLPETSRKIKKSPTKAWQLPDKQRTNSMKYNNTKQSSDKRSTNAGQVFGKILTNDCQ